MTAEVESKKQNKFAALVSSGKFKKNIFLIILFAIPVAHFAVFWVYVNFNSIMMAFTRWDPNARVFRFTWDHFTILKVYFDLDTTGHLKTALINTLYTFGFLTLFMLPWGFFITYFLYKKIALTGFWRTLFFIGTIIPALAMCNIFGAIV